jgi:hypothetical protein
VHGTWCMGPHGAAWGWGWVLHGAEWGRMGPHRAALGRTEPHGAWHGARPANKKLARGTGNGEERKKKARGRLLWLDRARNRFRFYQPSSFNTALRLVLRPHFLVHFV